MENTSHRTDIGLEDLSALRRGAETFNQVRARSPPYIGCHIAGRMEAASTRRTSAIGRIRVRKLKRIEEKDGDLHPSTKQGILRTSDATSQEGWKLHQYGRQHLQDGYRIRRLKRLERKTEASVQRRRTCMQEKDHPLPCFCCRMPQKRCSEGRHPFPCDSLFKDSII